MLKEGLESGSDMDAMVCWGKPGVKARREQALLYNQNTEVIKDPLTLSTKSRRLPSVLAELPNPLSQHNTKSSLQVNRLKIALLLLN